MMELGAARRSEREEVLDLLALWYNDRAFFARYNQNDPAFRDELCLVAREGGRIVSAAQIFDRKVGLSGNAVPMGGIGSVYTLEKYRGRGIASALMRMAVATMERGGFEVSLLFAERLGFYARFGWQSVGRLFGVIGGAPGAALSGRFEIEPFEAARELAEVARIYDQYSSRFDSTAVRDESYWRGNLKYAGNPEEYFVIARPAQGAGNRGIAAYARAIRFHGFPMVMEFGYRPDGAEAMIDLFRHLNDVVAGAAGRATAKAASLGPGPGSAGSAGLVSHTAHDPELEKRLRAAGFTVVHHKDVFYMWRVVNPQGLSRRLGVAPEQATPRMLELVGSPRSVFWTSDRF